jgi:5-methylthioadenosine/S-adenosylhomocysteine deaminase
MNSEKLKKYIYRGIDGYKEHCNSCINKSIIPGIFLHSFYMTTKESVLLAQECYNHYRRFLCTHLAEDEESEAKVVSIWGKRSIDILLEYNLLDSGTILIHGNTLTDSELDTISEHKSSLVLCPASATNLKTKLIDIHRLQEHNVNYCIATDGLASGESANLLYQTSLIDDIDSIDLLKAITVNPSKAMKLDREILADGSRCNMIVLEDTECDDVLSLCTRIVQNKVNIHRVYYNGKIVVDNNKHNGENI